ncbi:MAG: hypothetical protein CFH10_02161 [Alphaproteobacteria bacterium MarineAlpha4_Bin2]|nr:MAG: hypothetical protein CFH10_02161 [Alphaproteobacteria bacterium MarineAlpha4_Bin2]
MADSLPIYSFLAEFLSSYGLMPRGGFRPEPQDGVPGEPVTVILIGNVGPDMWKSFSQMHSNSPNVLDDWSKCVIDAAASATNGIALYPFGGPPFLPFQRWAAKAEPVAPSPLGILIHPEFGLWHAYRGALAYSAEIDLPPKEHRHIPCDTCEDKPCLSACPVGAFSNSGYEVVRCTEYLKAHLEGDCMTWGCRARRRCPIGTQFEYKSKQAAFHMSAFLES